jgi:cytochrome c553
MVRQLVMLQEGSRAGSWSPLMAQVVDKLSVDDMLALAAYTASLSPE